MVKRAATICVLALWAGCDGSPLPEALTAAGSLLFLESFDDEVVPNPATVRRAGDAAGGHQPDRDGAPAGARLHGQLRDGCAERRVVKTGGDRVRRILLTASLLVAGCYFPGQVTATIGDGAVRFTFDRRGKAIRVSQIRVVEWDDGRPGKIVCELRRTSPYEAPFSMRSWIYGSDVGPSYLARACTPLVPGRDYRIDVDHANCTASTQFRLIDSGSALEVGPPDGSCYM